MAALLTLADLKAYLRYDKTDQDGPLQAILDAVEDYLEDLTDQVFGASGTVTDEVHSGECRTSLMLRRPASAVTAINISRSSDPASVDDTIPVADVRIDPVNSQRLVRHSNGVFPTGIYNLFITYTAAANLPAVAIEAVKEAAALVHRIRGTEHLRSQSLGDLGSEVMAGGGAVGLEFGTRLMALPMWRAAVEQLGKPSIVIA